MDPGLDFNPETLEKLTVVVLDKALAVVLRLHHDKHVARALFRLPLLSLVSVFGHVCLEYLVLLEVFLYR